MFEIDQDNFVPFRDKVLYLISLGYSENLWEADAIAINGLYYQSISCDTDELPF